MLQFTCQPPMVYQAANEGLITDTGMLLCRARGGCRSRARQLRIVGKLCLRKTAGRQIIHIRIQRDEAQFIGFIVIPPMNGLKELTVHCRMLPVTVGTQERLVNAEPIITHRTHRGRQLLMEHSIASAAKSQCSSASRHSGANVVWPKQHYAAGVGSKKAPVRALQYFDAMQTTCIDEVEIRIAPRIRKRNLV